MFAFAKITDLRYGTEDEEEGCADQQGEDEQGDETTVLLDEQENIGLDAEREELRRRSQEKEDGKRHATKHQAHQKGNDDVATIASSLGSLIALDILHSIETATRRGKKAIRLDCLDENEAPQKMYLSLGFRYIGTVPILYEDIGESRDFRLYELVLSN